MARDKPFLLLVGSGVGLVLGEAGLRLVERVFVPVDAVAQLDDARLGIRARVCVADVDSR